MQQSSSAWPIGHIHSQQVSGITVIEFHGEIDIAAAQQILPDLDAATAAPRRTVVIHLGPVEFLDAYGLRLLCHAERRVTERHGWLLLVCPHPLILKILRGRPHRPLHPARRTRRSPGTRRLGSHGLTRDRNGHVRTGWGRTEPSDLGESESPGTDRRPDSSSRRRRPPPASSSR
ncbi:STAS domain-containing protein [Streptomyces sp. NPDC010273]|uniref:STAS domain-containing protein n=1 Tax=Streptomyces sp. NPDC010273 TaxID=3364829 RepID=UPI0036EE5733